MRTLQSSVVRAARSSDMPRLTAIYEWYVEHSHVTFDESLATPEGRRPRLRADQREPHRLLVLESAGDIAGYAASRPYRSHPAFAGTVETSIYLHPRRRGEGLGGRLYDALLADLIETATHVVLAAVALPNDASVALHRSRGFREVGTFTEYAIKRGERLSSMWFELLLDRGAPTPGPQAVRGASSTARARGTRRWPT
jgi:phosphinothricin acetyltransferase